jgi:hypothetical protein
MIVRCFLSWSCRRVQRELGSRRHFGTNEKEPGIPSLSRRSRHDLLVMALGAAIVGTYLQFSTHIEQDANVAVDALLSRSNGEDHATHDKGAGRDLPEDLPPPVRRYLEKVLPTKSYAGERHLCSVIKQSGEFYAAHQWYPFEATLMLKDSFADPAFVWNANTTIYGMPQQILQTLLDGKCSILTKAWGKVPTVQVQEEEPFVLFWLAMMPLCPQSLIRNQFDQHSLEWTVYDLYTARARLVAGPDGDEYHMEFLFDPTSNLLQSIAVTAACMDEPWKASYQDYFRFEGELVAPSRIKIGKGEGPRFRYHMAFVNRSIHSQ